MDQIDEFLISFMDLCHFVFHLTAATEYGTTMTYARVELHASRSHAQAQWQAPRGGRQGD